MKLQDKLDKLAGGLYGLLIGDALGVPYEFTNPDLIPDAELIEMEPPKGFRRAHLGVPIGTWSDDGAQALVLLQTLQNQGMFHREAFQNGLLNWRDHGHMTPDGKVFDIGIQTHYALQDFQNVRSSEQSNGNGSLMRSLPIALYFHNDTIDTIIGAAMLQSRVTHPHLRSMTVCALYCLVGLFLIRGMTLSGALEASLLELSMRATDEMRVELNIINSTRYERHRGSGYVVDSFWSAIEACDVGVSYEDTVKKAIQYGNDTDTTACIAGGLAGIMYGFSGIPSRWADQLNGKDIVDPMVDQLIDGFIHG